MRHVRRDGLTPFDFSGLKISDYGPAGALASVAEIAVPPGASHAEARSSRSDKYYLVVEGAVSFTVSGSPVALAAPDLLVIEIGE